MNYRPALWDPEDAAPVLLDLARRCDVVFVGRDEAATLWGTTTAAEVRALVGDPGTLVVKDGAVGAHAFRGETTAHAPAGQVTVVEPVGAGDAFAAGYLAATLAGSPADRRARPRPPVRGGRARHHRWTSEGLRWTTGSSGSSPPRGSW